VTDQLLSDISSSSPNLETLIIPRTQITPAAVSTLLSNCLKIKLMDIRGINSLRSFMRSGTAMTPLPSGVKVFCDTSLREIPGILNDVTTIFSDILFVHSGLDQCKVILEQMRTYEKEFNCIHILQNPKFPSLIHYCCATNSDSSMELLAYLFDTCKVDPNIKKKDYIYFPNWEPLLPLISGDPAGEQVFAPDLGYITVDYNMTPLHLAVTHSNMPAINTLLHRGADVNSTESSDGSTPLILAVKSLYGPKPSVKKTVVDTLLRHGANVHQCNKEGSNVMHYLNDNFVDMAKSFLDLKVSLSQKDHHGFTPIDRAIIGCQVELVRLYMSSVEPNEISVKCPYHLLASDPSGDSREIFAMLLDQQVPGLNTVNEDGDTPLIVAAKSGNLWLMEKIIETEEGKASIHTPDESGFSVLHFLYSCTTSEWSDTYDLEDKIPNEEEEDIAPKQKKRKGNDEEPINDAQPRVNFDTNTRLDMMIDTPNLYLDPFAAFRMDNFPPGMDATDLEEDIDVMVAPPLFFPPNGNHDHDAWADRGIMMNAMRNIKNRKRVAGDVKPISSKILSPEQVSIVEPWLGGWKFDRDSIFNILIDRKTR